MTTRQQLVVELAADFVRQNVGLAAICQGLGHHLAQMLPADTLAVMSSQFEF